MSTLHLQTFDRELTLSAFGFFNAYGNPARKDSVDYVLHLGDYIYEYKNGDYGWGQSIGRIPLPGRLQRSLPAYFKAEDDYRPHYLHIVRLPQADSHIPHGYGFIVESSAVPMDSSLGRP